MSDDDLDDEEDDNHSSIADGEIASAIDEAKTAPETAQPTESSIVLKQIRRLSSTESMPPPPPPDELLNKPKESNE